MNISPAPVKEQVVDGFGKIMPIWQDWANAVSKMLGKSRNLQTATWSPTFSGLTFSVSGVVTGTYTQRDNLVLINVTITPDSGTTTSVLDTTKITNLPKAVEGNWSAQAFQNTGKVDLGRCFVKNATNELYTPTWSTISGIIYLTGIYVTNE